MKTQVAITVLASVVSTGCSFAARSEDVYRRDTKQLLATRNSEIQACFDSALGAGEPVAGSVVVRFKVESDTGLVKDAQVVEDETTAPTVLANCVTTAIEGLKLAPGDQRDADATFTWEFAAP